LDILGVGPFEFLLILLLALIILGPREMILTARKTAGAIRKIVRSPFWNQVTETSREIRQLPTQLMREAGIENDLRELNQTARALNPRTWTTPGSSVAPPILENRIDQPRPSQEPPPVDKGEQT
jgi:Sec-independent protein translocase protein TatA